MYEQTSLLFYRFRFVFASLATLAFLMLVSALVTSMGANTILAHPSYDSFEVSAPYSSNAVTDVASSFINGTQHALVATGNALYKACRSITIASTATGRAIVGGSVAAVTGVWHGTTATARAIGSATMYTIRMPGRIIGFVTSGHAVTSIIKPSDKEQVPVISDETSTAAIAQLGAQQQLEITQLVAGQLAANRSLGGTIVTPTIATDTDDGGYPAKWNDAPQDSMLDSWGMYNRECVSYAAWKVYQTYGYMPYWGGEGNANEWPRDAERSGIPIGTTPKVHSVAISMLGYYGHAMWVEAVNGDMVYVSQYNYDLNGHYSEMWVNGSRFTYIYFS